MQLSKEHQGKGILHTAVFATSSAIGHPGIPDLVQYHIDYNSLTSGITGI